MLRTFPTLVTSASAMPACRFNSTILWIRFDGSGTQQERKNNRLISEGVKVHWIKASF